MNTLHNQKKLKQTRKNLGRKFRRQHSIGNYILDFYCPQEKLAIELDGAAHFTAVGQAADQVRDAFFTPCKYAYCGLKMIIYGIIQKTY